MSNYNFTNNQNEYKITVKAPSQSDAEASLKEIVGIEAFKNMDWKLLNI
tara:strand:+ start:146 stop:292 length:147 start_codon:yes stop_codon:yes gene_type:complete